MSLRRAAATLGLVLSVAVSETSALAFVPSALAQEAAVSSATFEIDNMTCALCPITVRKAMEGVAGVMSVTIDFSAKTATVTFDPALTDVQAIAGSSSNAGYPARVKG